MSFERMTNAELIRTQGIRSDLSPLERVLLKRLEEAEDKGRQSLIDSMQAEQHYENLSKMKPFDFNADYDDDLNHV